MNKSVLITLVCMLCTLAASHAKVIIDPETDQETRCGGPIEADEGSLSFPIPGQVAKPGEICIWTIHLQTTSTFRLNLTSLDIIGDDEDCLDAGLRLYSLTNLIPVDRAESYTFCNNQPPTDGNFFLSENLLTVVYHSQEDSPNAGAGFTLNWQGIAVQPIPKLHSSTYTSATSGIIRFPIEGEYTPNQVDTWLVKGWDVDPNLRLHLNFAYINLESCDRLPVEDCSCDAIILYEVSNLGILTERTRLCGNASDIEISDLGPNFILGFFTDHQDEENNGIGFELTYRPETTPTTPPTSTPPPASNISTSCGGLVFGTEGAIEYKVGVSYRPYERCVWTVRTPLLDQIRFTVTEMGLEANHDRVTVQALNAAGLGDYIIFTQGTAPEGILDGSVAIVTFHSDHSVQGTGFSMSFSGGVADDNFENFNDFNPDIETEPSGTLKHPSEGLYQNLELSTFVFAKPTAMKDALVRVNITLLDLETDSQDICKDVIHILKIDNYGQSALSPYTGPPGVCEVSQLNLNPLVLDTIVILLVTDEQGQGNGIELEWQLEP